MTRPTRTRADRLAIIALFVVYLGLVAWAAVLSGEGAPVPAVHQGRLG